MHFGLVIMSIVEIEFRLGHKTIELKATKYKSAITFETIYNCFECKCDSTEWKRCHWDNTWNKKKRNEIKVNHTRLPAVRQITTFVPSIFAKRNGTFIFISSSSDHTSIVHFICVFNYFIFFSVCSSSDSQFDCRELYEKNVLLYQKPIKIEKKNLKKNYFHIDWLRQSHKQLMCEIYSF